MPSDLFVEVCKIDNIIPHGNADRLELAIVKGWQCTVPINRYKKGDKVIYIPVDSMIPFELSEQLGITKYLSNPRKDESGKMIAGRVRTSRQRGVISHGVIIDLPDPSWKIGIDVKKELNITKYEPPIKKYNPYSGHQKGNKKLPYWQLRPIPGFDKYTHIQRFQNFPNVIMEGEDVVITEKIHGTNFRSAILPVPISYLPFLERCKLYLRKLISKFNNSEFDNVRFLVGSHNCNLRQIKREQNYEIMNVYWKIALEENLENRLIKGEEIFGEIYGAGIQKLLYDSPYGIKVKYFDMKVQNEETGEMQYLNWDDFIERCQKNSLPIVPVLYRGPFKKDILEKLAQGNSTFGSHIREGVVIKPTIDRHDERLGRVILKYINPEYEIYKNKLDDLSEDGESDVFDH